MGKSGEDGRSQGRIGRKTKSSSELALKASTVITGVIGSDAHIVGEWTIRHAFKEAGFKVVSLGALVSQEEFIKAAIETNAAAILVSSIYGHGKIDCQGFREKVTEAGLKNILLYIGGHLDIGEYDHEAVAEDLDVAIRFILNYLFTVVNSIFCPKGNPPRIAA